MSLTVRIGRIGRIGRMAAPLLISALFAWGCRDSGEETHTADADGSVLDSAGELRSDLEGELPLPGDGHGEISDIHPTDGTVDAPEVPDLADFEASDPDLLDPDATGDSSDADTSGPDFQCPVGQDVPNWVTWQGDDAQGTRLLAECGMYMLGVTVLENGLIRLRYQEAPGGADYSYAVVGSASADRIVTYSAVGGPSSGTFRICTPRMIVDITDSCGIGVWDKAGNPLLETTNAIEKVVATSLTDGQMVPQFSVSAKTPPTEKFYGFGEKTGPLNKRGRSMRFWNSDNPAYGPSHDPLYQSIPFFVGLRSWGAYGVFVDNSAHMILDMASQAPGTSYTIRTELAPPDLYVMDGPEIKEVVRTYTRLTGKPFLPPRWTLGYHQCRWSYYPDTKVKEICNELRTRQIPADGIWLDIDYMDDFRSFTWDPEGFSDPSKLVSDVEEMGFKVTAIIDPGLKHDPGWLIYDQGEANGYFLAPPGGSTYIGEVWPGPSVFPDFSNPAVRDWWGLLVPNLTNFGVRGIWLDMNEPASFKQEYKWTVPNNLACNGDGHPTTMAEIHNVYALLESKATFAGMKAAQPNRRPFLLTRAGFAGIQRYSAVWTGDAASNWPALRMQLAMMMNMGLSGVPLVGSDVGGWEGGTTPELFARWVSVGAVSPFFRAHVQTTAPNQEPWEFGSEVEEISRIQISERYRLLPYWYSLTHEAALTGDPILRPLVYEFQNEPPVWDIDDQAMIGPWLMVAPALEEGQSQRAVVLPAGEWLEYHSGAHFVGPKTVTTGLTWQALPMYLRQGAIVPKGPWMEHSDAAPVDPLQFELFPGPQASQFVMYEDDGETPAESQTASRVEYTLSKTASGAQFAAGPRTGQFVPAPRRVLLRFRAVDQLPTGVTLNGSAVPKAADAVSFQTTTPSWHFDANDRSLWVALAQDSDFVVVASYSTDLVTPDPMVQVTLRVTVPEGTPTTTNIHVATDANGWTQIPLQWENSNTAVGTVSVPRAGWFWYKYSRGDWTTVEKLAGCLEAGNRYAFGKAWPVKEDTVEVWADMCQ